MKKQDVKNILMSIRTHDNEAQVNNWLGKVDMLDERALQAKLEEIGDSEEAVRNFFENELSKRLHNPDNEHYPINDMFTYGTTHDCIHLHLPGDLHQLIAEHKSVRKAIDTVNLYLLDAIDKIKESKDNGFYRFQGKDTIFMISPILIKRELRFLESMDFETHTYSDEDIKDEEFLKQHPEAEMFINIFGKGGGTAQISFDTIDSKEWQEKKNRKVQEFNENGIAMQEENGKNEKSRI